MRACVGVVLLVSVGKVSAEPRAESTTFYEDA